MVRVPVLVLAEGSTVSGHVAPTAGLMGLPAAVPARLQESHSQGREGEGAGASTGTS